MRGFWDGWDTPPPRRFISGDPAVNRMTKDERTAFEAAVNSENEMRKQYDVMRKAMEESRARNRRNTVAHALERADRSLTGIRHLSVDLDSSGGCWTSGSNIHLQTPNIGSMGHPSGMFALLGANYHELAHLWFGIGGFSVTSHYAWNVLEDQRIETLAAAYYPSLGAYYSASYFEYVAQDNSSLHLIYPLAYGRRFLPEEHREQARQAFAMKSPKFVADMEAIIDEYRALGPCERQPSGNKLARVQGLVSDFSRMLQLMFQSASNPPETKMFINWSSAHPTKGDDGSSPGSTHGMGSSGFDSNTTMWQEADQQREADDMARDMDKRKAAKDAADKAKGGKGGKDQTAGKGTEDASGADTPGKGQTAVSGQSGPVDTTPGKMTDPDGTGGNGTGIGNSTPKVDDRPDPDLIGKMRDDARQHIEDAFSNREVQEDVRDMIRATQGQLEIVVGSSANDRMVDADMMDASVRFTETIRQLLADDVDPGWDSHRDSGRLNAGRYLSGADMDEVWDTWRLDSNPDFAMDAQILVDTSGSMNMDDRIWGASKGAWIVRRGIESLNELSVVQTMVYNDQHAYGYSDARIGNEWKLFRPMGGTTVHRALLDALAWFETRKPETNKVLFVLTDGGWGDRAQALVLLLQAKRMGIHVVLIGWNYSPANSDGALTQVADIVASVNDMNGFVEVAQTLVSIIYRAVGQRIGMGGR